MNTTNGISRRAFLTNVSIVTFVLSQQNLFAFSKPQTSTVTVRTPLGVLRGEESNSVRMFRGVPFAEPPVGPLRFKPPVKIKPWAGERDATKFTNSAMQTGEVGVSHSEDCLGINVWAPTGKGPFPVLFWLHGGGFVSGHAFDSGLDGTPFARDGIVVVTAPYRLGIFGFLDFGPLLGPAYAETANNALRDIVLALEWVRDNIASFGGDPNQVTIGGESAGGKLTDIIMGIPEAQPLFHQMISASGGAERVFHKADAAMATSRFGDEWKKASGQDLSALLTASSTQLLDVQTSYNANWPANIPQQIPTRPQIDGKFLPRLPIDTIAAGNTKGKRLLIGSNLDESAMFIGPHPAKDATQIQLGNTTEAMFAEICERYKPIYPHLTDEQRRIRTASAQAYWVPSIRVADAHNKGGGSTWFYRLDFAENSGNLQGYSYHSLDMGLVWSRPHKDISNAAAAKKLSDQMHEAWKAFIKGKAPAAPGLPAWPQYHSDTRDTMILYDESRVERKPNEAELRLWDGLI